MSTSGVRDEDFGAATILVDKLDKIGKEECIKQLVSCLGLQEVVAEKVIAATSAKNLEEFSKIAGCEGCAEIEEFKKLFAYGKEYGYGDWIEFDPSVVRGLAYYTGIVFEANDREGVFRAIAGGGRYDKLLSLYGSKKDIPMVGFAVGDCVIMDLLKEKRCLPQFPSKVDVVVAAYSEEMLGKAMYVSSLLRKNKTVSLFQGVGKKAGKVFSYAARLGARKVAFVAPNEVSQNAVAIKDLHEKDEENKQKTIPFDQLHDIDKFWNN